MLGMPSCQRLSVQTRSSGQPRLSSHPLDSLVATQVPKAAALQSCSSCLCRPLSHGLQYLLCIEALLFSASETEDQAYSPQTAPSLPQEDTLRKATVSPRSCKSPQNLGTLHSRLVEKDGTNLAVAKRQWPSPSGLGLSIRNPAQTASAWQGCVSGRHPPVSPASQAALKCWG